MAALCIDCGKASAPAVCPSCKERRKSTKPKKR